MNHIACWRGSRKRARGVDAPSQLKEQQGNPGLWWSGHVARGRQRHQGERLGLACDFTPLLVFPLRAFAVFLWSPFPLICPHSGLCTLEERPLIRGFHILSPQRRPRGEAESPVYNTVPFLLFLFKAKCSH